MTGTPPAYTPARWRAKAAALAATATAAVGAATIPAVAASAAPATAVLSGPAVYETEALNQDIPVTTSDVHTTAASLAPAAGQALPARYHYQTVALPGYPSVYVNGISGSGGYAGEGCKDRNCTKVALFAASPAGKVTFYTLPSNYSPAGPFNATATGMDNAGDVVGGYTDAHGGFHGFVRRASGALTQINDPQAAAGGTVADGISPDGSVIVGFYVDKAGVLHGFLLRGGAFTSYDVPDAHGTVVAFDNHGEFGGSYFPASGLSRGFYVIHGRLHTLRPPAEPAARHRALTLSAMDAEGTVFGYATSANLPGYGIAYANGRYTTFRDPHQAGTGPQAGTVIYSANSDGMVAGAYTYTNGTATQFPYARGFIARPDRSSYLQRAPQRAWFPSPSKTSRPAWAGSPAGVRLATRDWRDRLARPGRLAWRLFLQANRIDEATALVLRAAAARDLTLGLGAALASKHGPGPLRGWILAAALVDGCDALAMATNKSASPGARASAAPVSSLSASAELLLAQQLTH